MAINETFKNITQENKKLILYKITEIYSENDELLDFMDKLEWNYIDTVFNIIFAWNEKERNKIWNEENEKNNKLLSWINELYNKVNQHIIQQKEFIEEGKDEDRLKELESMF